MGGEGAVKLSTQFTQTAVSARVELFHCQTNEEGERVLGPDRVGEGGGEMDRGPKDEWREGKCREEEGNTVRG